MADEKKEKGEVREPEEAQKRVFTDPRNKVQQNPGDVDGTGEFIME